MADEVKAPFGYVPLDVYRKNFDRIKLTRTDGILTVQFHKEGGEFSLNPKTHREMSTLWHTISLDPENKIIILTGTGDGFLRQSDAGHALSAIDPEWWMIGHQEAKRLINDLVEVEQPMIAALNGPVSTHSQVPLLCDIVLATPETTIGESHLYPGGILPGDGHHVIWSHLLGFNRARAMLLTGYEMSAQEAKDLGLVHEIVPKEDLLARAEELARNLLKLPKVTLRLFRPMMMQEMKQALLGQLSHGLLLEGLSFIDKTSVPLAEPVFPLPEDQP